MTPSTTLDGDLALGRNLYAGGNASVQGSATIGQNLKVKGWLDAPNVIGACKGLFNTPALLQSAYPHPQEGWFAIVGHTVPGSLYVAAGGEWVDSGESAGAFNLQLDGLLDDMAALKAETQGALDQFAVSNSALSDLYGRRVEWVNGIYNSSLEAVANSSYCRAVVEIAGARRVEFYASLINSPAYLVDAQGQKLYTFPAEGSKEYAAELADYPAAKYLYINNYRVGSNGLDARACWVKVIPGEALCVAQTQKEQGERLQEHGVEIARQGVQIETLQGELGGGTEVLAPELYSDELGNEGYYLRLSGGRVYVTASEYRRFTKPIHLEPGETITVRSEFQAGVCPIAIVTQGGDYLPVGVAQGRAASHRANSPIDVAVSFDATSDWEIRKTAKCFSYDFEIETQRRKDKLDSANVRVFDGHADEWVYCPLLKGCAYRLRINNSNRTFYASPEKTEGIRGAFSLLVINGEQMVIPNSDVFFIRCNVSSMSIESVPDSALPACREMYIGDLRLGAINPAVGVHVVQASDTSAVMADYCVAPMQGLRVHVRLPDGWKCSGYGSPDNPRDNVANYRAATAGDQKQLQNGDIAFFHEGTRMYRFSFFKADNSPVDLLQAQELVDSGQIRIMYETADPGVIERSIPKENVVAAAMGRDSMSGSTSVGGADSHGLFTMLHITDLHGDPYRYTNALEYADHMGVDAVVMTGDYCMDTTADGMSYLGRVATDKSTPILPCLGNHDTSQARSSTMPSCAASRQIEMALCPFAQLGHIPSDIDKTYYCKDIVFRDAPTVAYYYRVIALNTYEGSRWDKPYITQAQIDWFISCLESVPDKYGVIILMHNVENCESSTNQGLIAAEGASNFMQGRRRNKTAGIPGMPISAIVDAWQGRGVAQGSFTNAGDSEVTTYSADFRDVPAGAEFICFLCGHEHMDMVGYNPGTSHRQAVLALCCGSGGPLTGSASATTGLGRSGDLPRRGDGISQDAFNIIAIDRQQHRLKIVRIGADTNIDLQKRDQAIISYA